jgi:AcrR family transcriptional regulator
MSKGVPGRSGEAGSPLAGEHAAAAMTMTPWGEAGTLRARRLRPGPGVPREDVERNQRERLYGAMVVVATTIGYGRTRVSDLIEVAGVSRATFYRYFDNKEECFLATLDELVAAALAATARPVRDEVSWEERARRGVGIFTKLVVAQPASARMCLVEAYAVGPAAVERVEVAMAGFEQLLAYVFEQLSDEGVMPPELIAALIGGMRKVVHSRLHRRTERELIDLLPEIVEIGISFRPPPEPLRYTGPRRTGGVSEAVEAERRSEDPIARIERATLATVATRSFAETSISEIAAAAGVSLSTFYAHFDSKEEAFDSALHGARMRLLAASEPAFRRARSWAEATRAGIEAGLAFLESDPEFARVTTVDVYGAGAEALEMLDLSLEAVQHFVDAGFKVAPDVRPAAREVIPSSMYAMLSEQGRTRSPARLRELTPFLTYLVLAPFLGPEEACATANAGAGGRRRRTGG